MEPDATNLSPAAESCGQAGKEAGQQAGQQAGSARRRLRSTLGSRPPVPGRLTGSLQPLSGLTGSSLSLSPFA